MVDVSLVVTSAGADQALALAARVWGAPPLNEPVLRALELAGSYLSVARDGGEVVGMCAGFVGVHDGRHEHAVHEGLHLHSHLAAVEPRHRGRGVGRALKRHQRAWCLEHGIDTVTWTFDPLVRANAPFNLHHLGAVGDRYLVDLYGQMDDAINRGDPTDRLLVRWDLDGPRATRALDGPLARPSGAPLRDRGAVDAVTAAGDDVVAHDTGAELRLVGTPADIVALRRDRPTAAAGWRAAVRTAMLAAFDDGLRPVAVTDDHAYVFAPPGRTPPEVAEEP